MARKAEEMTEEGKTERDAIREHFYQERLECPFPWLQLDTDWFDDEKLQTLRDEQGKAATADFLMLIARLAGKRYHSYDVSTESGWKRLSRDLEMDDVAQCKERIQQFAELGLIHPVIFKELHKVQNNRVMASAETYARSAAQADYMTWCRTRK